MTWKQIVTPRWLRWYRKQTKHAREKIVASALNAALALGRHPWVAGDIPTRHPRARIVLYKEEILRLVTGEHFLRYARLPSGQARLAREVDAWQRLRALGLRDHVQRSMELERSETGWLLRSELLQPIEVSDHVPVMMPILHGLAAAARPIDYTPLPPTVAAGLRVAREAFGGALPEHFASDAMIEDAMSHPLRTGASHGDLHHRNVMRDESGRSVLIDLKSCEFDHVLAFDLLNLACKHLGFRNYRNVIDNAFLLQRRNWSIDNLEPVLALVDLPRHAWGPLFVLHTIGRIGMKKGHTRPSVRSAALLRRSLSRDWRLPR